MKKIGILFVLVSIIGITASCAKQDTGSSSYVDAKHIQYVISASGIGTGTKTHISGESTLNTSIDWNVGDFIGLNIGDIQDNVAFRCSNAESGTFDGFLSLTGRKESSVSYVAYYPYMSGTTAAGVLSGVLPKEQKAPFDPNADYMISKAVIATYDEDHMPELNFEFDTHLFSIVKFSFVNTDPALASEVISKVVFKATGKTLSGFFIFDSTDKSASPSFSTTSGECSERVILKYQDSSHILGNGTQHTVYAIMNPNDIPAGDFKISVITENTTSSFVSSNALTLTKNTVTVLPLLNLSSSTQTIGKRTIVLWGDSITNETYLAAAQSELGPQWNVIRGGVPGDSMYGIAARQGSLSLRNSNSFTIPSDDSSVSVGTIYYGSHAGNFASSYYNSTNGPLINPVIIGGIEGNLLYDVDTHNWSFRRSAPGTSVIVPADTFIQTFASRTYRDADLISIYMGANGGPQYDKLLSMHQTMRDYMTKKEVIVLGYSMDIGLQWGERGYWSQEYVDLFTGAFGRRFIDQRTEGSNNAYRLLVETGVIRYGEPMSAMDQAAVAIGDWPESFFTSSSDNVHPNATGNKVMAILLRERMEELGYLE